MPRRSRSTPTESELDASPFTQEAGASPSPRSAARRPHRSDSQETQTRILDAAELLFAEKGFAATSLRAIAHRAGVNLAAAHYHFGSKEGLLRAALHRRIAPVNAARLALLDAIEARDGSATVREIVVAFLQPLASLDRDSQIPRLVGRLYGEPRSISVPILEREFGEVAKRFLAALSHVLPDVDRKTLHWRFHFLIGSMVQFLSFDEPPIRLDTRFEVGEGLEHLIHFAANGLDPARSSDARAQDRRVSDAHAPTPDHDERDPTRNKDRNQ